MLFNLKATLRGVVALVEIVVGGQNADNNTIGSLLYCAVKMIRTPPADTLCGFTQTQV